MPHFKTPRRPFAGQDARPRELKRGSAMRAENESPPARIFHGISAKRALQAARRWAMAAGLVLSSDGMSATHPTLDGTVLFSAVEAKPGDWIAQARPMR